MSIKVIKVCPILKQLGIDIGDAGYGENKDWIKDVCVKCSIPECLYMYPTWRFRYKEEIKKMIRRVKGEK